MTDVYQSTERNALAETEDPHKLVLIMFDALIKSMEIYIDNIDLKTADWDLRSKHFSRSLTIIYSLQSSLDFEKGGDIATNLFQLYEYARQQLIKDLTTARVEQTATAIKALTEIKTAWDSISSEVSDAR